MGIRMFVTNLGLDSGELFVGHYESDSSYIRIIKVSNAEEQAAKVKLRSYFVIHR